MTQPSITAGMSGLAARTLINNTVQRWFNVKDYGATGNGSTDDAAAVNSALTDLYANHGGVLVFPYTTSGYVLGSTITISPASWLGAGPITILLQGSTITPTHTGWCFDIQDNAFSANNVGYSKPVFFLGEGGSIWTTNTSAAGGIRFSDNNRPIIRDTAVGNYLSGDGIRIYISTNNASRWSEMGEISNVNVYGCLNGYHFMSYTTALVTQSFLGWKLENCSANGTVNGAKLFNFEGSMVNCVCSNCGGWYNQSSSTGGYAFYLNGSNQGMTLISPWSDTAGAQIVGEDIGFGPNYVGTSNAAPIIVNAEWISLPYNFRGSPNILHVVGPYAAGIPSSAFYFTGDSREVLTANRTYYVNPSTGNDSNHGLTSGLPFQHIVHAIAVLTPLDLNGFNVTIQLANGTYNEQLKIPPLVGQTFPGQVTVFGNSGSPTSVIVAGNVASQGAAFIQSNAMCALQYFTLQNASSSGTGLQVTRAANADLIGMNFGTCVGSSIWANGGTITCFSGTLTFGGNSTSAIFSNFGGYVSFFCSINFGTNTFSNQTVGADGTGMVEMNGTFSGTVTGTRYAASVNGVIQTYTGNVNYIPGSVAGYTTTGGQYN